jgi:UDP-2,3-diacylglucosamine hydrolase
MRTVLLSDAHLRAPDAHQDRLVRFVERVEADTLVLVGDVFDVWWGWDHTMYAAYAPIVAALIGARRRGVELVFIGGNHDFRAGGFLREVVGVQEVGWWRGFAGAASVVAAHGEASDAPWSQRAFDRFLHGSTARGLMRVVGPDAAWRIGARFAGMNRRPEGGYTHDRLPELLAGQARWAEHVLAGAGAQVICVGHTHAPGVVDVAGGRLVNLGDWVDHDTFAVADPDGVSLWCWNGGAPSPVAGPPARRVGHPPAPR